MAQDSAPSDLVVIDYAIKSTAEAKSISIVYDTPKDQPPVLRVFADKEWQLKFAELLRQSEVKRRLMHVFGLNFPVLVVKDSKLTIDFPARGAVQIEVDRGDEPLTQLDLVLDACRWDMLQKMIAEKRPNKP